jgi:hypothetical protein
MGQGWDGRAMEEAERNREILSGEKENQEKNRYWVPYLCDKIHLVTTVVPQVKGD